MKLAFEQNDFLNHLNLADNGDNNEHEIHVSIGADMYWKVVSVIIKKDDGTGLNI